jgi:hypothetical protein
VSELLPKAKQGTSARAIRIACLLVSALDDLSWQGVEGDLRLVAGDGEPSTSA